MQNLIGTKVKNILKPFSHTQPNCHWKKMENVKKSSYNVKAKLENNKLLSKENVCGILFQLNFQVFLFNS